MKKTGILIGLIITSLFVFSGCTEIFDALATPYGYVYDAVSGDGIASAAVTITNADGTFAVTTDANGQYDFNDAATHPSYGDYTLTVEKTGYAFTPLQVSLSGLAQKFSPVVGVTSTNDELLFVLMWDDGATLDVDAHMTYPASSVSTSSPTTYDAYEADGAYSDGFTPDFLFTSTNRQSVHAGRLTSSASNEIVLDRNDTDGTGPETISVAYTTPWTPNVGTTQFNPNTEITPLIGSGDTAAVTWAGTMEYYIDGNGDNFSTQGSYAGSHPVLYVFDGASCIGIYRVPDYTDASIASLARIQVLNDPTAPGTGVAYYIIYPDIRLLSSASDIRSASSEPHAPLVVKRR
ncbi:MAG: carboxypeptidase regulatory-like domain-containing protein [Spirochaetaceae bacterium]|nr:carboxypeptidase regulatory-like domain-containing protein [Spirochaetaceae bacterium]